MKYKNNFKSILMVAKLFLFTVLLSLAGLAQSQGKSNFNVVIK